MNHLDSLVPRNEPRGIEFTEVKRLPSPDAVRTDTETFTRGVIDVEQRCEAKLIRYGMIDQSDIPFQCARQPVKRESEAEAVRWLPIPLKNVGI